MRAVERPSGASFLLAVGLVIASFVFSSAYVQFSARSITADSSAIAGNALPGIQHLAAVRSELMRSETLLGQYVIAPAGQRPAIREEVDGARQTIQRELSAYLKLTPFAGERSQAASLVADLARLHGIVDHSLARMDVGDTVSAEAITNRQVAPEIARSAEAAYQLVQFNADQAQERAVHIETLRRRGNILTVGLDALSALLALLAGWLAWRTIRYYLTTLEAQKRLLEIRTGELESFAGRVSHDILTPLTSVSLSLDLLRRDNPAQRASLVERGRSGIRRVQSIVDALLTFARAGARPMPGAACSVNVAVDDAVAGLSLRAAEAQVELEVEASAPVRAACHPGVMTSVVTNLVANAIKYMGEASERRVTVRVRPGAEAVRVEVEDTGPGIPRDLRQMIFEPYVRANPHDEPGIGLGLATVKKLCLTHGGSVGVTSGAAGGSLFWFELPMPSAPPEQEPPPPSTGSPRELAPPRSPPS